MGMLFAYMHLHIAVRARVYKRMYTCASKQRKLHLRYTGGIKVLFLEVGEWIKPKQKTISIMYFDQKGRFAKGVDA